jgi:hypothetical protein
MPFFMTLLVYSGQEADVPQRSEAYVLGAARSEIWTMLKCAGKKGNDSNDVHSICSRVYAGVFDT